MRACLQDSLSDFSASCSIEFPCPVCYATAATKQILIDKPPKCLVVVFSRWKSFQKGPDQPVNWRKDEANVNYTETIDITPILTRDSAVQNDPKYTLRGVLEHEGQR